MAAVGVKGLSDDGVHLSVCQWSLTAAAFGSGSHLPHTVGRGVTVCCWGRGLSSQFVNVSLRFYTCDPSVLGGLAACSGGHELSLTCDKLKFVQTIVIN